MFRRKKCSRCGGKIEKKHSFCPNCGYSVKNSSENEDWGMLGKDDFMSEFSGSELDNIKFPAGFNMIFNSLMKNLHKQFEQLDRETEKGNKWEFKPKKPITSGISINISTLGNRVPEIKIKSFGSEFGGLDKELKEHKEKIQSKRIPAKKFSPETLKKLASLPKEEPTTSIRRLSNKVVYEIDMPGVKTINDVSIIRLENSIEIKALGKDKVYSKRIPLNLPITNYGLSEGKLVLELGER